MACSIITVKVFFYIRGSLRTFFSGDVVLQETFCYGDVLLWRRYVEESFWRRRCVTGDVLLQKRFLLETFCGGDVLCRDVLYVHMHIVGAQKTCFHQKYPTIVSVGCIFYSFTKLIR
jgi:hypothetical protein